MRKETTARAAAVLALIAVTTLVAYWPSLSVPFQFDDYARITGNPYLQTSDWFRSILRVGGARVLPAATLVANVWLSSDDTWSYHVVNLAVHIAATGAVFWLAWLLAATPRLAGSAVASAPLLFATAAATLFASHPLQTQAVTYIIQRAAAMSALFYVSCVAAYLAGRLEQRARGVAAGRRYFALAFACAGAALLSKENAVTLPLAVLLAEVVGFGPPRLGRVLKLGLLAAPLLIIPVVVKLAGWRWHGPSRRGSLVRQMLDAVFAQGMDMPESAGPLSYLATQMLVLPRYLRLLIWPVGLNIDHDVRIVDGVSASVVAGAILLLALIGVGLWALRRRPLLGFGILWFFVALSVESSLIPIHDVMMEHRVYLAMPGPALIFAAAIVRLRRWRPQLAVALLVGIVALLSVLTFERNQVWQSDLSLWSDAAAKSPEKARVHVNLGVAYHGRGELDAAIRHYCRAIEVDPEIALARDNIEIALEEQGRLDEVIARLRPRRVPMPRAPHVPKGAVILEYDLSEVVCPQTARQHPE